MHENVSRLLVMTDVNKVDKEGWTALIWASTSWCDAIVDLLLAHPDIEVNLADRIYCRSALMWASAMGRTKSVERLLQSPLVEVNLTSVGREGWSALMWAVNGGCLDIVELLLLHPSIDVNMTDAAGNTAIKLAAREGHESIARLLIYSPGIEITAPGGHYSDEDSVLSVAWRRRHFGIVRLLQEPESPEAQTTRPIIHIVLANAPTLERVEVDIMIAGNELELSESQPLVHRALNVLKVGDIPMVIEALASLQCPSLEELIIRHRRGQGRQDSAGQAIVELEIVFGVALFFQRSGCDLATLELDATPMGDDSLYSLLHSTPHPDPLPFWQCHIPTLPFAK
ncbi:ankyrin repeat-containing domain protein [Coprinopsis sp. MPI-PUGE-AT-0042]|nr:ankyrin repeat-containing domain protein [Coprinopsis sp. MPI-PUGE-AT-0042]